MSFIKEHIVSIIILFLIITIGSILYFVQPYKIYYYVCNANNFIAGHGVTYEQYIADKEYHKMPDSSKPVPFSATNTTKNVYTKESLNAIKQAAPWFNPNMIDNPNYNNSQSTSKAVQATAQEVTTLITKQNEPNTNTTTTKSINNSDSNNYKINKQASSQDVVSSQGNSNNNSSNNYVVNQQASSEAVVQSNVSSANSNNSNNSNSNSNSNDINEDAHNQDVVSSSGN